MSPARKKATWSIEDKTATCRVRVNVWKDGAGEYTLSKPAQKSILDMVLGRKMPWVTERYEFDLKQMGSVTLPFEVQRLLRRLNLPRDFSA